ncbi:TPA: superantigen-like protein [Staphylococcus delphini]|nr:superantigen-like protein [Staphylococcus delphini]HEC2148926.1 superantigen-like protein [Staphylococcus delphini]HEC2151045.1 superantigen-like protein [Staphylococcus delphini]HEC2161337.1 superantigen-like protein [Staphylococcus delphini]HEC2169392.1 superantigen-like protein [Staphylococcus delphini]
MNLSKFAKVSLVLGILTTGFMVTNKESANAEGTLVVVSQNISDLKNYYKSPSFEYKNVSLHREGDKVGFVAHSQYNVVNLLGSDKVRLQSIKDGEKFDVFVVREGSGRQADNYSIGGITKKRNGSYHDYPISPRIDIKKGTNKHTVVQTMNELNINKEEVSLKELDFKLRKVLIEKYELYKQDPKDSKIKITMKDGSFYTFELNKKLQNHRMGDVIDSKNIDRIEVDLKS